MLLCSCAVAILSRLFLLYKVESKIRWSLGKKMDLGKGDSYILQTDHAGSFGKRRMPWAVCSVLNLVRC